MTSANCVQLSRTTLNERRRAAIKSSQEGILSKRIGIGELIISHVFHSYILNSFELNELFLFLSLLLSLSSRSLKSFQIEV